MGKGMQDKQTKGVIKSGVDWFSTHFKRIFKRQGKEENHKSNLEELYRKHERNSGNQQPVLKKGVNCVYKKKSQILEITLKRLRRKKSMSMEEKTQLESLKQETINHLCNNQRPFDLNCPICFQAFVLPVPTVCGHTFCSKCIEDSLLYKPGCPVCRTHLRNYQLSVCLSVKSLINTYFNGIKNNEQKQAFEFRLKDGQQWDVKRRVDPETIVIGQKLDIRDTQYIWCTGNILKIYYSQGKISEILVRYHGWNSIYNQILDIKSLRLAPFGFYSTRKQIPRYAPANQTDDNYYSYVTTGLIQQQNQVIQNAPPAPMQPINQDEEQQAPIAPNEAVTIHNMQQLIQSLENPNMNVLQNLMGILQSSLPNLLNYINPNQNMQQQVSEMQQERMSQNQEQN